MDDDDKSRLVRIIGLVVALAAVFTLLSTVSYFFTWKADQSSLTSAVGDTTVEVSNAGGKLGYRWADLLVRKWFGLGSLAFIVILFAVSVRLLLRRWRYSMLKTTLLTFSGALVASFALAFVSDLTGLGNAFGGGLGGECGESVIRWSSVVFGTFLTGFLLVFLVVLWLVFASRRFSCWLMSLGKKDPDEPAVPQDQEPETPVSGQAGAAAGRGTSNQSVSTPSLRQAQEPEPVPEPSSPQAPGQDETAKEPGKDSGESLEVIKGKELTTKVTSDLPRINVRDELPDYKFPSLELLDTYSSGRSEVTDEELSRNNARIRTALENYRIQINDVKAIVGPTVTLYKVYPAPGVKISEIKKLQEDLGMHLHARGVRVVTLTDSVGIEVANDRPSIVPMRAVLNDEAFRVSKAELPVAIGYTIQQKVKVFDLADAPHLLVAGATKQGKSVGLNVIVTSLLYSKHPSELKLVFIDPKMVEFSAYSHLLKHYLAVLPCNDETEEMDNAIVKKADKADKILRSLCIEMDQRYELLSKASVPNIKTYNEKYRNRRLRPDEGHRFLPYMVTIIDEYADLTMSVGGSGDAKAVARSITTSIIRLAQKGRAAGLHVVLATQRPSVDVITGLIKTNFPTRIAFRVVSRTDSSTILDSSGAEKLIGKGDMLYYAGVEMERVQCAYIDSEEINRLTEYIGSQSGYKKSFNTPFYLPPVDDDTEEGSGGMVDMTKLDERFDEAAKLVVMSQRGSTSDLQRRLGMGYAKAGRVMDQLQAAGIVGPQEGSKPRQVLVSSLDELDQIIAAYKNQ
ncbi:MAG: DNA translocase FtsK 4TM domain-containing protein [Candidatus Cryptobacteroides sp.]|nr:DNA translocase FtsK [Alistipes sp.]MDY4725435.1 DNA translocase FtsK 4TM domain-containing protein [Candidatus Cryptobacteroides sp.]